MINVLLVTTWDQPCGIAEHSAYLKEAVEADGGDIRIIPQEHLDPTMPPADFESPHDPVGNPRLDVLHLNYQAALLSRWSPDWVQHYQKRGVKVVITYHDTGVPNSYLSRLLFEVADAFVIHEPADDLRSSLTRPAPYYWRMGVPGPRNPYLFGAGRGSPEVCFKGWEQQPVLGTVGFPFPWKNYDQLARVTRACGWALLLIAPHATPEQVDQWRTLNPDSWVRTDFTHRTLVGHLLAGCDATAFCYVCHNTGQSGAILQGIGARKPVIALKTCRQFRALYDDPLGQATIRWAETFEDVADYLREMPIQRIDPGIVALAEQESWARVGKRYADLYRRLVQA
jgi:hypothetical protein